LVKVVERPVTVWESYNRAKTGPKVSEKDWDFKIIPQSTAALKKKYNLKFDRKEIIPTDKETINNLFQAGLEMLVQNGVYCIDTQRVIKVTEAEVMEGIKKAPWKLVIGEGKDAVTMAPRSPSTQRWPVIQGGPTGAPVSEELFIPTFVSFAQEAIVDDIVSGVMNTVEGNDPTPGSPWEIKGTRTEVALVREACMKAGRPGMGL
jgi:methylamine--corrinoid protein Co-methyltransferase